MKSVIKRIPFDIEKAKAGAKVVTRDGHKVDTIRFDRRDCYPISGWIRASQLIGDSDEYASFTEEGYYISSNNEDCRDLFIEEEAEETDDYDPYKAVVESIADMVERYSELQSIEELKDFYNNVRIKCRDAFEYDNTWNKKQDEKPADNKPKFKKGDWVVFKQDGNAHQIIRVVENATNHTYGYDTADDYYFNDTEESVRRWTIQEAKNGDVLVSDEVTFIFNRIKGEWIHCCCTLHRDGSFISKNYDLMHIKHCKEVQPATKEQCDLLFQKMKEAGYEWDSVKKELHKIGKEVKTRRMTNQELSWWLDGPLEEHRECIRTSWIYRRYSYLNGEANKPVEADIYIRKNGGEWQEPVIEIE